MKKDYEQPVCLPVLLDALLACIEGFNFYFFFRGAMCLCTNCVDSEAEDK